MIYQKIFKKYNDFIHTHTILNDKILYRNLIIKFFCIAVLLN